MIRSINPFKHVCHWTGMYLIIKLQLRGCQVNNQSQPRSLWKEFVSKGREKYLPFRRNQPSISALQKKKSQNTLGILAASGLILQTSIIFLSKYHWWLWTFYDLLHSFKLVERPRNQAYPPLNQPSMYGVGNREGNCLLFLPGCQRPKWTVITGVW